MQIDWWTLGLQAVNVLVLLWLLSRFLFTPVAAMVKERQAAIAKALDEARSTRAEAQADLDKAREETAHLAEARTAGLKAAASEAEAEKASIIAAARAEAGKLREAAEADIARARGSEQAAVSDRASRLAVDIAAKLFARLPDEARISGFAEGLAQGLAALPEESRAGIGADGAPIRIKAPRALTEAETQACRARLADVLGRPVDIHVDTDPALIAGLEIDTPHAVVRNSFRADLERIAAALTQQGNGQAGGTDGP